MIMKNSSIALACAVLISGCASIDHTRGIAEINFGDPEQGVTSLASATKKAPSDAAYKVDFLLKRDEQIRDMLKEGNELRETGRPLEARELFDRIIALDAGNPAAMYALKGIKQDLRYERILSDGEAMLAKGKFDFALDRSAQVIEDFPRNRRAIALRDAALDARAKDEADKVKDRAAKFLLDTPVTLQFSDTSLRSVFEGLSKSTGLNVLFDKDVKLDNKATIFAKDVNVSDAIDLVLMQNQLQKRVINGNTLLIYPATAAKQVEYEDLTIKTFQITNADIKYVSSMLKSMLKIKEISADEKTGILVLRDTPETLRMAERLIAAHDVADPEIMLEVEVLEVSNGRTSNLGLMPPANVTISTPGSAGSMTLGALQRLSRDDLLVSPLSTTLNFKLEDTDSKILASPRIRARNKETAKIMIGDRVPTITNTVTPVNAGSSVVTGNVTYQDVGLKLEFKPQVYASNEVGIEIVLEVSNIAKEFADSNGGRSYQIGTRNASTNLRLKDGETQILGGLITDEDRNTASKIPGLGHIPIIGKLFGNNSGTATKSEIILAITPRIVRNLVTRDTDTKNIFSGPYNAIREKPILTDPGAQIKVGGTFGGTIAGAPAPSSGSGNGDAPSGLNFNPAQASSPLTFSKPTTNTGGLNQPPPMVNRGAAVAPTPMPGIR